MGNIWYSNLRPVRGSFRRFRNSNADEPVAIICTSGMLSTISLSVKPMLFTFCASSITINLALPNSNCSSRKFRLVSASTTCGSSQLRYCTSVRCSWIICLSSVVFPTCRAPRRMIAFPWKHWSTIIWCKSRLYIPMLIKIAAKVQLFYELCKFFGV